MELTECCVTLAGCALPLRIEYNIAKSRKRILKWHKVSKVYYSAESSRSYVKYDSYCIKLHLVTLRCITLHCIMLHYIALYGKCGRSLAWLSPIGSSVVTPRPSRTPILSSTQVALKYTFLPILAPQIREKTSTNSMHNQDSSPSAAKFH